MNDTENNEVAMSRRHTIPAGDADIRDFASEIQQACSEVNRALAEQDNLHDGALKSPNCLDEVSAQLKQGRERVNLALGKLRRVTAKTLGELGMKFHCFQHVKTGLGEEDTRVGQLAIALLDEAAGLFSQPSSEGLNGYLETGNDPSTRTAWRSGLFTRADLGGLLGRSRRSHAGE